MTTKKIAEIAELIQGKVVGDGSINVEGITNFEIPVKGAVTFIQDVKYLAKVESTDIACLIVPPSINESLKPLIQVQNPKLSWAKLLQVFFPAQKFPGTVSEQASIASSAQIGKGVTVEPFARIGENVVIGDDSVIRSNAFVGDNVSIGSQCIIHPSAVIYEGNELGNRVIIHAGAVIGTDGFGYVATMEAQEKVPQVGQVAIADDVEIGACSTIDRATVGFTRIEKGVKIDNLVQIAHNVTIGPHTVISSQTGISGSSKVGAHVTMGGKVGLGDHVEIGDWTMVGAGAGLPTGKKVPGKQVIFGAPARPYQQARKQIAAQLRAAEMLAEIKSLRKRVTELEQKLPSS